MERSGRTAWLGYGGAVLGLHALGLLVLLPSARAHPMLLGLRDPA